jgi:hypothetical protein
MLKPPVAVKPPALKRVSVKNFLKGVVSAYDDGSVPPDGLKSASNVILTQNGTVRPRPSLQRYGPQPLGTVLGEIFPFRNVSGTTSINWLISLQNVSGTTSVYIAKGEDTTWTLCSGKTYDNTARAHFIQVANKVLVMNGVDTLSYLEISSSTVIPFTSLTTPAAPTLGTNTGLSGSTFNMYYAVTWNSSIGETAASSVLTTPVSTDRDQWNSSTQSVSVVRGTIPAGAKSWNLYAGQGTDSSGQPQLYAIATGLDTAVTTYTDNGTAPLQLTVLAPTYNSTAGPKVTRGAVINGRPWLTGDADNPYYVWRGGDPGYELDFSPSNGGGFSPVGSGTENIPVKVTQFRDGKGTSTVTVLSQGLSGKGKRYLLSPQSVTYGTQTFIIWEVQEDNGQDGTDSPDAVITYNDQLHYPSRDGFKYTGTQPQLQNVLSTKRESNSIQTDITSLNITAMKYAVGMANEGRLYYAVPNGSSTNNEIWVLDLDRGGAWMKPWNIVADWMNLYTDNSGNTHHLVLSGNRIYELSYVSLTADNGTPFVTGGNSGQIKFSEDGMMWGKLVMVIFTIYRPQGSIDFTISGNTKHAALSVVGNGNFATTSTRAGWSEPLLGWSRPRGWSEVVTVPVAFNDATQYVKVKVNKDMRWFSYGWSTTDSGVDYSLADVTAVYAEAGIKDLT